MKALRPQAGLDGQSDLRLDRQSTFIPAAGHRR